MLSRRSAVQGSRDFGERSRRDFFAGDSRRNIFQRADLHSYEPELSRSIPETEPGTRELFNSISRLGT